MDEVDSGSERATAKGTFLRLEQLFLDPNNYRFIDNEQYSKVESEKELTPQVQQRSLHLITGENQENIRDLLESFRKNGWLPVDQIQVRQVGDSKKFVVVEGNRRLAALKYLQENSEKIDLGQLNPEIFKRVPVVYYKDHHPAHHLILMGLKHISGNKKWPAINQAKLIRSLKVEHNMPLADICKSIAVSQAEARIALQTLAIIDLYLGSNYGDQFGSDKYSLFREIVRSVDLKNWLKWDSDQTLAGEPQNLERLFGWLSREPVLSDDDDETSALEREPVITKSTEMRDLARLVKDPQALENLDATRNLQEASHASHLLGKDKLKNALDLIEQEIGVVFGSSKHFGDPDRAQIKHLQQQMASILNSSESQELHAVGSEQWLAKDDANKFHSIQFHHFRRLQNIQLTHLQRINLVAGPNNAGKSSLLEAVRLLCGLNDSREFLHLVRQRAKVVQDAVDMNWFVAQIPSANISAQFANTTLDLSLQLENHPPDDISQYLNSAHFSLDYGQTHWESMIHFFARYPQRTEGEIKTLCPAIYASPFVIMQPELIADCYGKSLRSGSKQKIIQFIREHIDAGIENIELDTLGRFIVMHDTIKPNPDLTMFGEGLQRLFKLGLLFAGAQGGVVLIDEFDNALHTSLLPQLAHFVYKLALEFNVQVFLSTHSKECVEAFVLSEMIPKSELAAYCLIEQNKELKCFPFTGERLAGLIENMGFDLRGVKPQ